MIDPRELLTSTARVVGAQLGALHFKTWMALVTLHVAHGMPADGKATSTIVELTRLMHGSNATHGGKTTRHLLVFSSERVPYRPVFGADQDLEMVEIPLTVDHCHALAYVPRRTRRAAARSTTPAAGSAKPTGPLWSSKRTVGVGVIRSCASCARSPRWSADSRGPAVSSS